MNGDHTPFASPEPATLTSLGARQMYDQGTAFRNRYLEDSHHDSFVGIVGISPQTIDNSHLNLESSTDYSSLASAVLFMQSLYPPFPGTLCDLRDAGDGLSPNHSMLDYPLCGYQYPDIKTIVSGLDPDSIWSHGHENCTKHENSLLMFSNDSAADSLHQHSNTFFSSLWDTVFCEAFPRAETNFYNAHDLYDFAAYRWNNGNRTQLGMTSDDLEQLRQLAWQEQALRHANVSAAEGDQDDLTQAVAGRTLASRVAALFTENIETNGTLNKLGLAFTSHEPFLAFFALADLTTGAYGQLFSQLPSAGSTMTFELFSVDENGDDDDAAVAAQSVAFDQNIGSFPDPYDENPYVETATSYIDKRSGTYGGRSSYGTTNGAYGQKPIDDDDDDDDAYNKASGYGSKPTDYGNSSPGYGKGKSLSGYGNGATDYANVDTNSKSNAPSKQNREPTSFPSVDQLYVRFLYRNSTDADGAPVAFPLFGGSQTSISFKHFNATMWSIGIANVTAWCNVCESNATFCLVDPDPPGRSNILWIVLLSGAGTLLAIAIVLLVFPLILL